MKSFRWLTKAISILAILGILAVCFRQLGGTHDVGAWRDSLGSAIFPLGTAPSYTTSPPTFPSPRPKLALSPSPSPETGNKTADALNATSSQDNGSTKDDDPELFAKTSPYINAIMNSTDTTFPRLECPWLKTDRYTYLRSQSSSLWLPKSLRQKPSYFFALNMFDCAHVLPRLFGSIIEAIKFFGPESCVLSVVEGRSQDGTFEILHELRSEMTRLGVKYILQTSDLNPKGEDEDRIKDLAILRSMAVQDLVTNPSHYAHDTTVIFSNDISLCLDDILELIHQRRYQNADMTCAMDWIFPGPDPIFYDVWIARTITGDTFFHIPPDGSWDDSGNLFWNAADTRARWEANKPFQVFACWNGIAAFGAKPLMEGIVKFRGQREGECYQGEPNYFAKDLWFHGFGRIAVVPSVNVGYFDPLSRRLKEAKGYATHHLGSGEADERIEWEKTPPAGVICAPSWESQEFVPWDQALPKKGRAWKRLRERVGLIDVF